MNVNRLQVNATIQGIYRSADNQQRVQGEES
jgi:hypothetical protein